MAVRTSETHPITTSAVCNHIGKLRLSYCPGKNVIREGISWRRTLATDLAHLRSFHKIDTLVCLLSDVELRALGVARNYHNAVKEAGMNLVTLPIIEMAAPDSVEPAAALIEAIVEGLLRGEVWNVHCRGGVGRAGMVAACVLLRIGEATMAEDAIRLIRKRRCRGAVESRRQEDFVRLYARKYEATLSSAPRPAILGDVLDSESAHSAVPGSGEHEAATTRGLVGPATSPLQLIDSTATPAAGNDSSRDVGATVVQPVKTIPPPVQERPAAAARAGLSRGMSQRAGRNGLLRGGRADTGAGMKAGLEGRGV